MMYSAVWTALSTFCYTRTDQIFLVLMIWLQINTCQCGRMEHNMFPAQNRVLKNSAYQRKPSSSYVQCGRDCSMNDTCKSFNFFHCNRICELNNSTRAGVPEAFLSNSGSVYFDADDNTLSSSTDVPVSRYSSCKTLHEAGHCTSGNFTIYPDKLPNGLQVYCDMDGGGWIVFQRRKDNRVDFSLRWTDYKTGFGDLSTEFWLGNDNLVALTSDTSKETWDLQVELQDWNGERFVAKYKNFKIVGDHYELIIGEYDARSTAPDSLRYHEQRKFSTIDKDQDSDPINCAGRFKGGWWFGDCLDSNLNGHYYPNAQDRNGEGIVWTDSTDHMYPLKEALMKIRET